MSSANKRKGTQYESDLVNYFRARGLDAERLRLSGSKDEGDLVLKLGGRPFVLEAKNAKAINLADFVHQAAIEAGHYASARKIPTPNYAAIVKRRQHSIDKSYVIAPLHEWLDQIQGG